MIIITGGVGFIGSHILAALEKVVNNIAVVDMFGSDDKWRNVSKRRTTTFISPDIIFDFLEKHKKTIKLVLHFGGISSTMERNVDRIVKNNINLSIDLYEFCIENKIRFIYASSAATYGNGDMGLVDRDDVEYLDALRPLNAYGWSKYCIDKHIWSINNRNKSQENGVVALKFFNVYGPNEYHKGSQCSVIYSFYNQLKTGNSLHLFKSYKTEYKDGEQRRDFVWIEDCVNVVLWMIEHTEVFGIYNVGSGIPRTFNDIARIISSTLNRECHIEYIDMPEGLKEQYQYYTQADISKLRSIGYNTPMTTLEKGISEYINNFLNKNDRYL